MRGIAVGISVALGALATVALWGGYPVTASSLTVALVTGLALGSIYALAATGIVVTYASTGIFNFAQGAMGMVMAFLYWTLVKYQGWNAFVAMVVVVGVAAPAFGVATERLLMRHLVNSTLVVQLVATIGYMVGLMGLATMIWNPRKARTLDFLFGLEGFHVGDTTVPWHRAITIVVAALLALGLRVLLFRTRLGVTMRAVVDNRALASLHGATPSRVSMTAWALSTSCAALAGILLAPELSVAVQPLTLLTISAFAAAIVGRLRSLPLTFAGAMALGVVTTFSKSFLDLTGRWVGIPNALPSLLLLVALLAVPQDRIEFARFTGRLSNGPDRIPSLRRSVISALAVVAVIAIASGGLERVNQSRLTLAMALAVIMLSYVPLAGWAGHVSLAQITFAGFGAFAMWKFGGGDGSLLGLLIAPLVTLPLGLVVALPALRLHGLYLALSSLAFALLGEYVLFPQTEIFGTAGRQIARPEVLGVDLSGQRATLIFITCAFAIGSVGIWALRRGRFGRRLVALRDSEAASVTFGVNPIRTKLVVFGLSAMIAGFGGALLQLHRTTSSSDDFTLLLGLPLLLLVVVGGVETPGGALFGGLMSVLFLMVHEWWHVSALDALEVLGPGLLALGVALNPDGAVVAFSRAVDHLRGSPPSGPQQQQVASSKVAVAAEVEV